MKKNKIFLLLRDGFLSTVLSLICCYLISFLFFNITFFNPQTKALKDFSFLDTYYSERLSTLQTIDTNIVLVNIAQEKRPKIAAALQSLIDSDAKTIGFDLILKRFDKTSVDTLLAKLVNHEKVVAAYILQPDGKKIENHSFFIKEGITGFVNFNSGTELSVIREFDGLLNTEEKQHKSFSLELAKRFMDSNNYQVLEKKVAEKRVLNYSGNLEQYTHLTLDELLLLEDNRFLKNKLVLMGYLGTPTGNKFDIEDKHFTPLNEAVSGKSAPDMYGIVVHANILSMMIVDDFMLKISKFWQSIIIFLCSFFASIYFIWLSKRLKISYRTVRKSLLFIFSALVIWLSLGLFKNGIVLKTTTIVAVTIFSAGFVKYYKHLVLYINSKRKFKSYFK